jgi:hypothetical protein
MDMSFPNQGGRATRLSDEEHQRRLIGMQYRWKIPRPPKKKRSFHEWPNTPVFSEMVSHWKIHKTTSEASPNLLTSYGNRKTRQNKKNSADTTCSVSGNETSAPTSLHGVTPNKNENAASFHTVHDLLTTSSKDCENVRRRMSIAALCS